MAQVTPRTDNAVEFLSKWSSPPWVLTAVKVSRQGLETRTLHDLKEAQEWIEKRNGEDNLYFHVNPVLRDLSKKAQRTDIKSLAWLHVDIDPRAGEDIEAEQARALKLLREPPGGIPKPTCIVFSGGGYQGFWKLEEPVPIDGDLELAEDAKRYNQQLEVLFGADNCHNVDRIMRLPGTVNLPDKKKQQKGRKKALARLVDWNEVAYPITDFVKAQELQDGSGFGSGSVEISGNVPRLQSVDELPAEVEDWCRVLIVQGEDPNEPDKFGSRSECLFAVCCHLIRAEVSEETIYSIITDPDFRISESVLEKKSRSEGYAKRQIERAREYAVEPHLMSMNERHAVIGDIGGKCRVISEVWDQALNRPKITRQSFEDLRNRYMHIRVEVGTDKDGQPVKLPLGKWWLEHHQRKQFETVVFAPNREVPGAYNLWKGFGCEARPGDCEAFYNHVRDNICRGNTEYSEYLFSWMARAVQKPDCPGEAAVVLRGRMGTGKGVFAKVFGKLWGRHYLQVSDPKHLVGNFNAHLRDCILLFGDEAFYAGDKKHESILKMLVTEDTLIIEPKGIDAEAAPNYTHLILASNNEWVVPAGADERRFFVLDVGDEHMRDSGYFKNLFSVMEKGGYEALLHDLLTRDLSGFDVRKLPQTSALRDQKMLSFESDEEWWFNKLVEGHILREDTGWAQDVTKDDLLDDYVRYMQRFNVTRRGNSTALGKFLKRACDPRSKQKMMEQFTHDGHSVMRRAYVYEFPDLDTCRREWDKKFGGPYDWLDVEASVESEQQKEAF